MKSILVGLVLVLGWQAQAIQDPGLLGYRLVDETEKKVFIKNVSASLEGRNFGRCSDTNSFDMKLIAGEFAKINQVYVSEDKSQPLFIFRNLDGYDFMVKSTPDLKKVISLLIRKFSIQRVSDNTLLEKAKFIETFDYDALLIVCPIN